MIKIDNTENWFVINWKFCFTENGGKDWYINFASNIGKDMNFGRRDRFMIEYPWEYDKDWYFIKTYAWDNWKLNYIVKLNWKKVAIIQNPDIIEKEELEGVWYWVFTDPFTAKLLDKLELEWERIDLNVKTDDWVVA